jgi:hypothetical protein
MEERVDLPACDKKPLESLLLHSLINRYQIILIKILMLCEDDPSNAEIKRTADEIQQNIVEGCRERVRRH